MRKHLLSVYHNRCQGQQVHKTDKKFSTKVLLTAKEAVRGLSDIRSDLKGYASLVLEYELEKIAAAPARTEDGQEYEASC